MTVSQPTISTEDNDCVQPFLLDVPNFRGRMVRLDNTLNDILQAHDYPPSVAHLLTEAITVTTLLAGMLKFEGIFTLQTKGDGIVPTMVCDLTHDGYVRGYAVIREDADMTALQTPKTATELIGKGYIAFTVDQKATAHERYQGLVSLHGDTLIDAIHHYFRQSEQIKTGIKYHAEEIDGRMVAAAVMLQALPQEQEGHLSGVTNTGTDDWRRVMMLMDTATAQEMLSEKLPVNDMVYRLFHEEEVRVFDRLPIQKGCRCSREGVSKVLHSAVPYNQLDEYKENEIVFMQCEFCNKRFNFNEDDLKEIYQRGDKND